jgi:hypothetical protein
MATEVEILLKAIDQASAALNQVKGSSEKLGKGISGLEKNWNSMKSNVPGLSNVLALATNPITLVTAGVGAMAAVIKAGVSETVSYNKTIREMSQVTGLMPEELSRVVQAADDWGISIDSVRTALQMANKNGVTPSIDMLANLADEYVNSTDKTVFADKAIAIFGKQYATLIPMLSKGGDELRKVTGAVNDNLIATQKEIDASREYEVAVDDLTDMWSGFKQEIGNAVIPTLTNLLSAIKETTEANESTMSVADRLTQAFNAGTLSQEEYAKARSGLMHGTVSLTAAQELLYQANKKSFEAATKAYPEEERFIGLYNDLKPAIDSTTQALEDEAAAQAASEDAARQNATALSDLYDNINGQLGPEFEDFTAGQDDLEQQMSDVQAEIDLAIKQGYNPMGEKISGLQGQYSDLAGQYDASAKAHEDATRRIIFDLLAQRAGVDGLSSDELAVLSATAVSWGLVDQATADAGLAIDDTLTKLGSGETTVTEAIDTIDLIGETAITSADEFKTALGNAVSADETRNFANMVGGLRADIGGIEGTHQVVFNSSMTGAWPSSGGSGGGRGGGVVMAGGADYIVPPGFDQDNYPLGFAQSGERVIVIPKNQVGNTTHNSFNMTVHTNAGISTLLSDYSMMKARVS